MAKNNGKIRLIYMIAGLLVLFGSIMIAWTVYGKDIESNTEDISELKEDGCDPAQGHKTDIALIKKDVKNINEDIGAIRVSQEAMETAVTTKFEEILKRLPE